MKNPNIISPSINLNAMRNMIYALLSVMALSGCVKEEFDAPPSGGEDPVGISANTTIRSLRALYTIGSSTPIEITEDWIISGIVNADDKDGNLYKVLTIQDSTAGIQLKIDNSSLYTEFPVGRRVFIKCKGLFLGEYSGMVQMGGFIDNSEGYPDLGYISNVVAQEKILKGKWGLTVEPKEVSIGALDNTTYQAMLIKIKDVQFACPDIFQPYADAVNKGSLNRTLEDCSANTIIVRTSGYSRFAAKLTPGGKNDVTAVYTVFKSGNNWTKQLVIRNQNDVVAKSNVRCDGSTVGTSAKLDIANLRALYTGATISGPCASKIYGVVISDNSQSNFDPRNAVIQDATGGIAVRFAANHSFLVGDSIEVSTSGTEISEFRGLLQLNNTPITNAVKLGTSVPSAKELTLQELNSNLKKYESTLVKVNGVTLSGNSGKYGGSVTMNDGTGTFTLYTRTGTSSATFSNANYPAGAVSVTGVTSVFNSAQMSIRTIDDVQ
jgi:hypothetical protein